MPAYHLVTLSLTPELGCLHRAEEVMKMTKRKFVRLLLLAALALLLMSVSNNAC